MDVLEAVRRLLEEPQFQDVHFKCNDGRVVSSNRAFLAARCEYFERLLFGDLRESSCSEIRLHASSEAVRHVLVHLHTGGYTSIEQEACWITLMEASSLAQQYILPGMVQHVADRLSADLSPQNLGLALSHALKADLQAVIKSIWVALPRLLQRPFTLDRSFSADAICFCLQHTAWMSSQAPAGSTGTVATSSNTAAAGNPPPTSEASGTAISAAMNRASSINGASIGSSSLNPPSADGATALTKAVIAPGSRPDSSMAQEAQAFSAVLDWMLQEVAGCAECQSSRHVASGDASKGSCIRSPSMLDHVPCTHRGQGQQYAGSSSSSSLQQQILAAAAATPTAGAAAAGSSRAGAAAVDRSCSLSPPLGEVSQPLHPAMQSSRQQQRQVQTPSADAATSPSGIVGRLSSHSVRSSYESDTTEGEQDIRSMRSAASATVTATAGGHGGGSAMLSLSAFAAVNANSMPLPVASTSATAEPGGGWDDSRAEDQAAADREAGATADIDQAAVTPPDGAVAAQDDNQHQDQGAGGVADVVYSGCCCEGHQSMLLHMLAHLNWHLLEPRLLSKLDSLALLGPTALLEIFRAQHRCCHGSQWGNFPSLALGGERGLRCYITGGEQVLECESVSHLTATSNLCFTRGRHCWQFVVSVPCDLVWLGLSDGSLQPDVWGGKQPGGWFYGSNDALCHNKQSDRHAYTKHCGNGKWGDGAVVDVYLDMDAREVWFGVDGAEPKLGFTGLPDKVYPAVSLRAPAQLLVRFRAASWLMACE